jgi:hypothetical protein
MATKPQGLVQPRSTSRWIAVDGSWRSRVTKPIVTDPKRRQEAIDRATSLIKSDAQINTVSLGRD